MVTDDSTQRMNPVTGALKFLLSTTLNTVLALAFFLVVAHYQTPTFVGKVAIIQLLELIAGSALTYLSPTIYTREISQALAKNTPDTQIVGTVLTSILAATPTLLLLLLFPTYIWLSIPYLALYVYSNTLQNIATARGHFTEGAVSAAIFSITRWGLSAIPAYLGNIKLLILIWTLGALTKTIYLHLWTRGLTLTPSIKIAKNIFIEGLPVYISTILTFVSSQGDRVATAFLLHSYYLGIYQLASLISSAPLLLASAFTSVLLPSASFYAAKGINIRKMSALTLRFSLYTFTLVAVISAYIGDTIIRMLFPSYTQGIPAFRLLVLATMLGAPYSYLYNFIVASKGGLRPLLLITGTSAAVIIASSIALIPKLGIFGAAISQALVQTTTAILITLWAIKTRVLEFGKREIFVSVTTLTVVGAVYLEPLVFILVFLFFLRFSTVVNKSEYESLEEFIPKRIHIITRIIELLLS